MPDLTLFQRKILHDMLNGSSLRSSGLRDPGKYCLSGSKRFSEVIVQERTFKKLMTAGYIHLGSEYGRTAYLLTEKGKAEAARYA